MSERVKQILGYYNGENVGVLSNLYRMMNTGNLAGTGKMVILPVDQGFEHGPARSFAPNPEGYDPAYHFQLALESGCNAYAAPLGALRAAAAEYAGQIPLILKLNNSDSMYSADNPCPAITGSVRDALELGAAAVGFTIYPGSAYRNEMYEQIREISEEARSVGLCTVIWSYPRGEGLSKDGETAVDIIAYAAHVAAQLGAHIVKVKAPTAKLELGAAKKVYEAQGIKIDTLADRTRHVVQSTLGGKRIVIFSGGPTKGTDEVLEEVSGLAAGGAYGSIMGRNAFQRPRAEAIQLLKEVQNRFAAKA